MSNLVKSDRLGGLEKLKAIAADTKFKNDFGHKPLLLAFTTDESSLVSVFGVIAALVGAAAGGPMLGALVVIACLNDVRYLSDKAKGIVHEPIAPTEQPEYSPNRIEDFGGATLEDAIVTRDIGPATKLNAIPVTSEDVIVTHINAKVQVAAHPTMAQSRILCPIQLLAEEPFRSTAMLGGQRSGKTYIVALHTQNMKKTRKTVIFYVNLFDATYDAADDWSHADFVITAHIKKLTPKDAQAVIEKVGRLIKQFSDTFNAIFVFDEWAAFTSKANAWGKKAAMEQQEAKAMGAIDKTFYEPQGIGTSAIELMNICMGEAGELASIGKKQFKALWLIAPFMKAGDVEQQGLVMKSLHPMMVAIPPGRSITWTRVVDKENFDQQISFDTSGYIASMPNFAIPRIEDVPHMQCDRMIYLKDCWHSLDTLPALDKTPVARDVVKVTAIASPIEALMSEVEVTAIVDTKPDGIEEFPLVDYLWQYLDGKEARNLKQISDAFRKSNTISETDLKQRMGTIPNYKDGIHNVLLFGVKKGFINQVSPDVFTAVKRH